MRDEILENHPQIKIVDALNFYDTSVFNECVEMNYVMETLDIWKDVHSELLTLPMEWEYAIPYGLVYAKSASSGVRSFITLIQQKIVSRENSQ